MIAYIKGTLLQKSERSCVVLTTSGVGYDIFMGEQAMGRLGKIGEETELYIQTIVREDVLALYGFFSWEQREVFGILIGVPKLGPKTALAMLACFEPGELALRVAEEDIHALTRVPGIGLKSAKRILLDLKDKLKGFQTVQTTVRPSPRNGLYDDTLGGLLALGYTDREAEPVVRQLLETESDLDVGGAIRMALKLLSKSSGM
ncbi:MAG: Holliday junction branch migration protein RuvA [Desulfoplanes sp.]